MTSKERDDTEQRDQGETDESEEQSPAEEGGTEDESEEQSPAEAGGTEDESEEQSSDEEDSDSSDSKQKVDASEISAPSIGPNTVIETESAEDRLARHEQSNTDAMGLDKRRSVIGGRYSPSIARQATLYGVFIAVVAALVIGALLLVKDVDQAPASNPDEAPWNGSKQEAIQPQ